MKYLLILTALFLCACEWLRAGTQFIARCDNGRIVYNLSNFTVSQ